MYKKVLPIGELRAKMLSYLNRASSRSIDPESPTALVLAPAEASRITSIPVSDLPSIDDLPFIPERMRDFAFRYATEYKPHKFWAKDYGVGLPTISRWLAHSGVRAYIAVTRYERRMYNFAMSTILERKTYKVLNDILGLKLTVDNVGAVLSTAKFVWKITNDAANMSRAKGGVNINIGYNQPAAQAKENQYRQERDVTPTQAKNLKSKIENLEAIAKDLGAEI